MSMIFIDNDEFGADWYGDHFRSAKKKGRKGGHGQYISFSVVSNPDNYYPERYLDSPSMPVLPMRIGWEERR